MAKAGVMETLRLKPTPMEVTLENDATLESEIVLSAIRESCGSDEEFANLMDEAATEMALYGVIDDADVAMEAAKRVVIKDYKAATYNRLEKRTAVRLAKYANDPLYKKYHTYREKFLETREAIYKKYANASKKETKKILMNARRKSANMPSPSGKTIVDKIDKQIEKATGQKG